MNASRRRCPWSEGSALMQRYHDEEWGVPLCDRTRLFEFLVLDGAQAGLSWQTILNKRDGYRRAFRGFDVERVARFGARDVRRLLKDASIVRNQAKIASAIANAKAVLSLEDAGEDFVQLLWSFVDGEPLVNRFRRDADIPADTPRSQVMSRELKRRGFRFVGPTICYAFMQAAGMVNDHLVSCFRYRELS